MAVKRNRKKNQAKKNIDEIFKKFDHNQNQRVSIRQFTEVEFWSLIFFLIVLVLHKIYLKYFIFFWKYWKYSILFWAFELLQELSEELEVEFNEKERELLQRLAGEDGLVIIL